MALAGAAGGDGAPSPKKHKSSPVSHHYKLGMFIQIMR